MPDPVWTIQLLGGLSATGAQRSVTRFRTQKAASLLAYLAAHRTPQPRETLVDLLWPDAEIETGRHNLSNALSALRHLLEPPGVPPGTVILADRLTVHLNPAAVTTDIARFEEALHAAERVGTAEAERISLREQAVALYRGRLLPGFYDDWIGPEATRLEARFLQALSDLVADLVASGRPQAALPFAQAGVAADPLSEDATRSLMSALAAAGQPAQALRAYRALAKRLDEELGARPSGDLERAAGELEHAGTGRTSPLAPARPPAIAGPSSDADPASATRTEALKRPARTDPVGRLLGGEFLLRTTTRFFGREDEAARLAAMLSAPRTRLVTLTGPAGTGKTRLAIEVAAQLVSASHDTVHAAVFVPMAEVTDPASLFDVILNALGLYPTGGPDRLDQLAQALASEGKTLLVLDNFEHLVDDGAMHILDLLARADDVKLLVTSRQSLRIGGEHEFHLAPLPTSSGASTPEELMDVASVALFVDRAQSALPDFQITPRNAAVVAQLCDWLEGIPLAIELAAARVSLLSPSGILEQVQANRLDFLATRRRDRAARQQTLRSTLDWSYRLLSPDGQRLLAMLSVFRGGWTLEAAQALSGLSQSQTQDLLMLLRDSSLIGVAQADDGLRFTMLETVREYGDEALIQSGQKNAACRRHAEYFIGVAEDAPRTMVSPQGLQTIRRIGQEQTNLRAAQAWLAENGTDPLNARPGTALIRSWMGLNWMEVARWPSDIREDDGTGHPDKAVEPMASLLWPISGLLDGGGRPGETIANLHNLARLFREHGEPVHEAWTLTYLACHAAERHFPDARCAIDEACRLMRAAGTDSGLACVLSLHAHIACFQGEYDRANELNDEALRLLGRHGDTMAYGRALLIEGQNCLIQGRRDRAREFLQRNIALRRRIQDRPGLAIGLGCLGQVAHDDGDFEESVRLHEEALAIYDGAHWSTSRMALSARISLGFSRLRLGHVDAAESAARGCLQTLGTEVWRYGAYQCLVLLAETAAARGQSTRAARLLGAAETARTALGLATFMEERKRIALLRQTLIDGLGPAFFAAEEQVGKDLDSGDAIALALDEPASFD